MLPDPLVLCVAFGFRVGAGVKVAVAVGVAVFVAVGVNVAVAVGVSVKVAVAVGVKVMVAVGVGEANRAAMDCCNWQAPNNMTREKESNKKVIFPRGNDFLLISLFSISQQ